MTRVSCVVSTITKLSEETERRLTASAGYDSLVQLHCDIRPLVVDPSRPAGPMHEPLLGQDAEDFLQVVPAELLGGRERQLERRALHVIDEDVQVVGIDERVLRRGVEEIRRVPDDELIERRTARHHAPPPNGWRGGRRVRPAATSTRSCRDSRPSPPRRARRCRCRARGRWSTPPRGPPFAQPFLDLPPPVRQVAAAIAANPFGRAGRAFEVVLQIGRQNLGRQTALREHDQLQVAASGTPRRFGASRRDTTAGCRADD